MFTQRTNFPVTDAEYFVAVAYDANMVDYRWGKGDRSITIFNDMMAEFDVVNVDFAEKNASYVSGL